MTSAKIIAAARRFSGLEDIGDPAIVEGLEILLQSYADEARFTPAGHERATNALIDALATRMRIIDWLKHHPELLAAPVDRPLFVFGLPRTGTTHVINLLNSDPAPVAAALGSFPSGSAAKAGRAARRGSL